MKVKKIDLGNLKEMRKSLKENQSFFWARFGVTQSGGSRYESGRNLPKPVALLLLAYLTEALNDEQLAALHKRLAKQNVNLE